MFTNLTRSLAIVATIAAAVTLDVTAPASAEEIEHRWYGEVGAVGRSTLVWSEDGLGGFDGCNAFSVLTNDTAGEKLPLRPRLSSALYCSFKTALERADYAMVNGDSSLDLYSADGQKLGTMLPENS